MAKYRKYSKEFKLQAAKLVTEFHTIYIEVNNKNIGSYCTLCEME